MKYHILPKGICVEPKIMGVNFSKFIIFGLSSSFISIVTNLSELGFLCMILSMVSEIVLSKILPKQYFYLRFIKRKPSYVFNIIGGRVDEK